MKKSILIIGLFCLFSTPAHALLMSIGDGLIYDSDLGKVWYDSPGDIQASYADSFSALSILPDSTAIDGEAVQLTWSVATYAEVQSLHFEQQLTRELFVPSQYETPIAPPWGGSQFSQNPDDWAYYVIGGQIDDFMPPDPDERIGIIHDVWVDLTTGIGIVDWDEIDGLVFYNPGSNPHSTWAIASTNPAPAPEPSSIIMIGAALFLIAYKRKIFGKFIQG